MHARRAFGVGEPSVELTIVAHEKSAAEADLNAAVEQVRRHGGAVSLAISRSPGEAVALARNAAVAGTDVIVAAGGDGTLNEVVTGLMDVDESDRPAVGLLPMGAANDFARSAGVPLEIEDALRLVLEGRPRWVDVGRANGRWFMNVATGGFATETAAETSDTAKSLFGKAAYLLTGLTHPQTVGARPGNLRGPGFAWSGHFLALAVGNGRQAGGGVILCPDAVIDDGLFDVAVLPESRDVGLPEAVRVLVGGLGAVDDVVLRWKTPWVEVESNEEISINLDGEPTRGPRYRFDVMPRCIPFILPDRSPLLHRR